MIGVGDWTLTPCIKRDFSRRVTLEELDDMMVLWFNDGAELQAGVTLGRHMKEPQLGVEFVAASAYAQAFAHLKADTVSVELELACTEKRGSFFCCCCWYHSKWCNIRSSLRFPCGEWGRRLLGPGLHILPLV